MRHTINQFRSNSKYNYSKQWKSSGEISLFVCLCMHHILIKEKKLFIFHLVFFSSDERDCILCVCDSLYQKWNWNRLWVEFFCILWKSTKWCKGKIIPTHSSNEFLSNNYFSVTFRIFFGLLLLLFSSENSNIHSSRWYFFSRDWDYKIVRIEAIIWINAIKYVLPFQIPLASPPLFVFLKTVLYTFSVNKHIPFYGIWFFV